MNYLYKVYTIEKKGVLAQPSKRLWTQHCLYGYGKRDITCPWWSRPSRKELVDPAPDLTEDQLKEIPYKKVE